MNKPLTNPAPNASVSAGNVRFGNDLPLALIAGPCQMESRAHALEVASALKEIAGRLKLGLVYKSSFDKANRTSAKCRARYGPGRRTPGIRGNSRQARACRRSPTCTRSINARVWPKSATCCKFRRFFAGKPICLIAAAKTGRIVNVKKGQFLAPWDMKNVVEKVTSAGNANVLVTERGVSFGYNTLVSDMRALPVLRETGAPVIFDATHSVQQPGGQGASSGGERKYVGVLARAAVAIGVAGVFIETHPDPDRAPSDGPNMIALKDLEPLLVDLIAFDELSKSTMARSGR